VTVAKPCGVVPRAPHYKHVIWIWMENHSYGQIIGSRSAPYINKLAAKCGLAVNYRNVSHPSLPNYLAATSGLSLGQLPRLTYADCSPGPGCTTAARSIFGQGETWRAYQESMPSPCAAADAGPYAVRHNPPPYYTRLAGCHSNDVPYSRLAHDLAAGSLPAFSFITPNVDHDMHDGTVAQGSAWLATQVPLILKSKQYRDRSTVVFITWDEGDSSFSAEDCTRNAADPSCHVATLVISPSTRAGTRSGTLFSHYSLLATAEKLLGLPLLGKAATATTMTAAFRL
jgi:phospholipase C